MCDRPPVLLFHDLEGIRRRPLNLFFILRYDLAIGLIDHERPVHTSDSRSLVAIFGFEIPIPHVLGFMHMGVGVDDFQTIPHR